MKLRNRHATRSFKETRDEGMDQTGDTCKEHTNTKVGRLKQVFKVGLPDRLWMISKQSLNKVHQSLPSDISATEVSGFFTLELRSAASPKRKKKYLQRNDINSIVLFFSNSSC
jgi:hypothetical protein